MILTFACWIYFLAEWLWYGLHIFFYSETSSSCWLYTCICVFTVFYMNLPFIFEQNDIFQLCSDKMDLLLCFFSCSFNTFTVVRPQVMGPETIFLFLPLACTSAGVDINQNMLFTAPVSSSAHSRCLLTLEEGLLLFLIIFYTNFICKMPVEAISPHCMDLLCSWVNADLRRLFSRDTLTEIEHFLFNFHKLKGQCLCEFKSFVCVLHLEDRCYCI